jgi:beta-lactamase superfamily II metal-dependent hydrolase
MLRIELLPAHQGDSVLIEYGTADATHRILIDGGPESSAESLAARLAKIGTPAPLELMVVTHVDEDHIGGMLKFLSAGAGKVAPKDFWFNTYKHLFKPDKLGGALGEGLTTAIEKAGFPLNQAWGGKSVVVPDDGDLPTATLPGGAKITLVSPSWDKLEKLQPKWEAECKAAKIVPGGGAPPEDVLGKHPPPTDLDVPALLKVPFNQDPSAANGSCIAFLLEYAGLRVLLGADAHPDVVLASLKRFSATPVALDAFKVCHHGSRNNTNADLLAHLDCKRFLVSSNGDIFGHPDPEAIARMISTSGAKSLCFNYDTAYTSPWTKAALRDAHDFQVEMPDGQDGGIVVEL